MSTAHHPTEQRPRWCRSLAAGLVLVLVAAMPAVAEETAATAAPSGGPWHLLPGQDWSSLEFLIGTASTPELDRADGIPWLTLPVAAPRPLALAEEDAAAPATVEPLVAPLPAYNPTFGWTVGMISALLYTPALAGETESPWITGIGGFYSETASWGLGVAHKMNLDDDRWRLMGAVGYADLRYDFYGVGSADGNLGLKVPLAQEATFGLVEVLRETLPDLYLGLRYLSGQTAVGLNGPGGVLPGSFDLSQLRLKLTLAALALRLQYDTRDSDFYPSRGALVDGSAQFYEPAFGSDRSYQSYQLSGNWFLSPLENQVIAFRLVGKTAQGGAPFFALPAFGARNDLRGYVSGQYRDRWLVAGQVEYRFRFWQRLGAVVFAGLGGVAPQIDAFETALPSVGAGLRYVLAQKNNVSFRFDVAQGRDDLAFYFSVGEAF